jgi:transcriptional regulator with XRE-family HTH domain
MSNSSLITLALTILGCNQTELAKRLEVSKVTVSKWKNDEPMSQDMKEKITTMLKLDGLDPDVVLKAGSIQDARKWEKLIIFLGKLTEDYSENTYQCEDLTSDSEMLTLSVFRIFDDIGCEIPKPFPAELDIKGGYSEWLDDEESGEEPRASEAVSGLVPQGDVRLTANIRRELHTLLKVEAATRRTSIGELLEDLIEKNCRKESGEERRELLFEGNPHSAFIKELFKRFADINAFYMKYMFGPICDLEEDFGNIGSCLIELAAANMEPEEKFAPKFRAFKRRTRDNYEEWIDEFKKAMFTAGMPLEAEYMDLVKISSDFLSSVWETDKLDTLLGEADERIHPDIYMNEILLTLRRIDSVLPLILGKLEISQEEIEK